MILISTSLTLESPEELDEDRMLSEFSGNNYRILIGITGNYRNVHRLKS